MITLLELLRFSFKTDLINENINKILYPLFYLNNFYDISIVIKNNQYNFRNINNDDLLINLTLNNISKEYEKQKQNILMDFNYLIYYLNYKLRYCLTIFIKTGKNIFETEEPFITYKSEFDRLIQLVHDIKNQDYQKKNKINITDLNKLLDYIKDIKKDNIIIDKKIILEIIDLFDITSYISLLLFQIYIDNYSIDSNYNYLMEYNSNNLHNIINCLYKFSLIFNEIKTTASYHKKLLIFSLFNIFCICPIPNIQVFNIYNNINCCLLNKNSILLSKSLEETYLDIFTDNNNFLYSKTKKNITTFDSNGNNLLINNDILCQFFMLLLSKYVNILFEKNKNILIIPKDPFKPNYKFIQNETYYHEIIYYSHVLNYKIIKNEQNKNNNNNNPCISVDRFWKNMIEKCSDVFNGFKTYYPFNYFKNNYYSFSIYNYLVGFFFNSISSPQVLLSFIREYNDTISSGQYSQNDICYNEMYILLNFIKIHFTKVNLNKYKNDLIFNELEITSNNFNLDFNELLNIFRCIQDNRPSLLVSMLFLRRILPYILYIISEGAGIETMIYFSQNETIFVNGIKLLDIVLERNQGEKLVNEYLKSLKQVLWEFSLNGKQFSTFFKDIKFGKKENFVNNRNDLFYDFGINKINRVKAKYEESFNILNYAYEKMFYKIRIDYNWNFHFFELLFHCFYLTFADCSNKLNYSNKNNQYPPPFIRSINDFLDYYEYYDYYLNFINQEGAYMNISRLINTNYYKNFNYVKFKEKFRLRSQLIQSSKYDYMSKKGIDKINISSTTSRNFLILDNHYNENSNEINIVFNHKNKNDSLFSNNYENINNSLKRFIFEGYDDKKNTSTDEYYNDLMNYLP